MRSSRNLRRGGLVAALYKVDAIQRYRSRGPIHRKPLSGLAAMTVCAHHCPCKGNRVRQCYHITYASRGTLIELLSGRLEDHLPPAHSIQESTRISVRASRDPKLFTCKAYPSFSSDPPKHSAHGIILVRHSSFCHAPTGMPNPLASVLNCAWAQACTLTSTISVSRTRASMSMHL